MTANEYISGLVNAILTDKSLSDSQKVNDITALNHATPYIKLLEDKAKELKLTKEEEKVLIYQGKQEVPDDIDAYKYVVLQLVAMSFIHNHKSAVVSLCNADICKAFVADLTEADLNGIKKSLADEDVQTLKAAEAPTIETVFDALGWGNVLHIFEIKNKRRTKDGAVDAGAIEDIPTALAIPTATGYSYGLSLYNDDTTKAHLLKMNTDGLKFSNGRLFFEHLQVSEVELQNLQTGAGIQEIDLAKLRIFYSIILNDFEKSGRKELKPVISVYLPDLAEFLGGPRNLDKQHIGIIIDKIKSYHNITGVLHIMRNGRPDKSYYQVLNFEKYDAKTNIITFSSPYMNYLIQEIYKVSVRKNKKTGTTMYKKNGDPQLLPSHSYLVHGDIAKERNKAAVENVFLIVTLIEQAGDNIPRIAASTLVERNPQLRDRVKESGNVRRLLQRTFSKTWELLRDKTDLQEVYQDIKLPAPDDPACIPTKRTLKTMVFTFEHKGKKKKT